MTPSKHSKEVNYPYAFGSLQSNVEWLHFHLEGELRSKGIQYDAETISILKELAKKAIEGAQTAGEEAYKKYPLPY